MATAPIKFYCGQLQRENYKSFYLAFLRVAVCLLLLKETFLTWPNFDILYGENVFLEYSKGAVAGMHIHYLYFHLIYIAVIITHLLGIGKYLGAAVVFYMFNVLYSVDTPIINGGDTMMRLVLFYLIFADSYQHFVLLKKTPFGKEITKIINLLSNLSALSIMLQLCYAYFTSALAKIHTDIWYNGEAVYYILLQERYMGTMFNKALVKHEWFVLSATYFTILFELLFPVLIWIKKLRPALIAAGILLHAGVYLFLMLYNFQLIFMLVYGLFLSNKTMLEYAKKIQYYFYSKRHYTGLLKPDKNLSIKGKK